MNDFTKEELQLILSDVAQCDMEYSRTDEQEQLMCKIQSLIANYCEHEFKSCLQDVIGYRCNSCGKVTNDY